MQPQQLSRQLGTVGWQTQQQEKGERTEQLWLLLHCTEQ
jgi:hypothetical protein